MKKYRSSFSGSLLAWMVLGLGLHSTEAQESGKVVKNDFGKNRQGWQVYDYNGGKPGGGNVFFPATWEKSGGIGDSEGKWGEKQSMVLKNEEKLWHRSWSRQPGKPASLDDVLGTCDSYGFSFVGFSEEVTGKFAIDALEIELTAR